MLGRRLSLLTILLACLGACVGLLPTGESASVEASAPIPSLAQPSAGWLAGVGRELARREYHASPNREGLQAPNRRHNLRSYFEPTGVRVVDRTAAGSPALAELRLVALGRDAGRLPVSAGTLSHTRNRVEIQRPGVLEWYENSEAGLEQGFTLEQKPAGDGPLTLALAVAPARAGLRGEAVVLATPTGRRLGYGKLAVSDATGAPVAAHFAVASAGEIHLVVDDAAAPYPLVVDPLLTETADSQLESDQMNAALGVSVASAGDVDGDGYADVIVGANFYDAGQFEEGAAFVFLGSATGIADGDPISAAAQLESNQADAQLGISVAGAGDVNGDGYADVIVGASGYDDGEDAEGAAFVFLGSATGVANGNPSTAAAQLESDQMNAALGVSVASAGDVDGDGYADVIVGANGYANGESGEGAAFVFLGSATGVADGDPTTADSRLESDQMDAALGVSVASAGDVNGDGYDDVIVGANGYDDGEGGEGAAFVFLGSATGVADGDATTAATQLESDQMNAALGVSVASAGDVNGDGYADVIVGADGYGNGQSGEGAAFVFLGSATGVADGDPTTAAAQLESDQMDAALGVSVASAGDVDGDGYADVIVGANGYANGQSGEGAAFVFLGSATGVADGDPSTAHAQLESDQMDAALGVSVAGAGDVDGDGYADVIVGANGYDADETGEGAAFVYRGGAAGIADGNPATAAASLESDQEMASMGRSVAGAGDVNGDGYGDVIVGAYMYDAGEMNEGAAFVFLGSATGVADGDPATALAQLESDQEDARMGESVAGAGDVNGDGYADVIVGAWRYDSPENDEGAAFVFLGSASGIADGDPTTAHAQLESNQAGSRFGFSVASAGDVDGDGYADVIVGSSFYEDPEVVEGAAFVFSGSASGIADGNPSTAATQLESNQVGAQFGNGVAGAGDVNGDGYADVIVGAPTYDEDPADDEGSAFVFLGSATGVADGDPSTAHAQLESTQDFSLMGFSVAGAGDIDGDGYGDVIVGASYHSAGEALEGMAVVFHGSSTGIADGDIDTAATRITSNQVQAFLGHSVAGAGDVNGDGYADVIVGANRYDNGEDEEGAAFVFLGSATGIPDSDPTTASALLEADQEDAFLGWSVAGLGDVNGDGFADVIAGAPFYDAGEDGEGGEGVALVFLGNDNRNGRPVLTRQLDASDSSEALPWGTSSGNEFDAVISATHPAGRGRVKVEIEACPPGAAFGAIACTSQNSAAWTEIIPPATSVVLTETVTGLTTDTLYRWRARVLHAPTNVTATGITPPPNPAHGPWRRVTAQHADADIRVLPEPGTTLSLSAGIALLGLLHRRRTRSP